jgi:hypothetical protein
MKSIILWIIAIIITIASAYYQRLTGPTYPIKDQKLINNKIIKYELERSYSTSPNYLIEIKTYNNSIEGLLGWKRYKTDDSITYIKMKNINGLLTSELPAQPSAGKLEYNVFIKSNNQMIPLSDKPIVIRFKDDVPNLILYPHIILIFLAMLLSTRTGLEIFNKESNFKKYTNWTLVFIILG